MMEQHDILRDRGWDRVAPWFLPQCLPDVASGAIAVLLDLRGHNLAPISACSTGAHAVMEAAELIRRGDADVVFAGGGEACIHPLIIAGFTTMKGLGAPRPGEGPETASRPFDATRDGFVCAEGATVLVLESVERAEARGARIHAEVVAGRQHERRLPRRHAAPRLARRRHDDGPRAREGRHRPGSRSATSTRTAPRRRRAMPPRRRPSRRSSATTRAACSSRRRSRPPATSSAGRARSRSRSARSRCATRSCRRRSTTAIPIPSATSTTCPKARGGRARVRALELDGPRRPQRLRRPAPLPRLTRSAPAGWARQARIWPSPCTTYFVVVMSARPTGPRACRRAVELPISAPKPNSPPSVKRVEALT